MHLAGCCVVACACPRRVMRLAVGRDATRIMSPSRRVRRVLTLVPFRKRNYQIACPVASRRSDSQRTRSERGCLPAAPTPCVAWNAVRFGGFGTLVRPYLVFLLTFSLMSLYVPRDPSKSSFSTYNFLAYNINSKKLCCSFGNPMDSFSSSFNCFADAEKI